MPKGGHVNKSKNILADSGPYTKPKETKNNFEQVAIGVSALFVFLLALFIGNKILFPSKPEFISCVDLFYVEYNTNKDYTVHDTKPRCVLPLDCKKYLQDFDRLMYLDHLTHDQYRFLNWYEASCIDTNRLNQYVQRDSISGTTNYTTDGLNLDYFLQGLCKEKSGTYTRCVPCHKKVTYTFRDLNGNSEGTQNVDQIVYVSPDDKCE